MRYNLRFALAASLTFAATGVGSVSATVSRDRDGSVRIDEHSLRCGNVRQVLDARLPNLGIAIPGRRLLVINPQLLGSQPKPVRLFVFHHECEFEDLPQRVRSLGPWIGSREGAIDRLKPHYRLALAEQGFAIVYQHPSNFAPEHTD
jgi:hypothetical protein